MSGRRAAAAIAASMAAVQLWLAHRYFGFLTGDEVEVLAEAFRAALGFRYRAWEIRNLFVPDFVVAPAVWLAHAVGVRDVGRLIEAAALPSIALSIATVFLARALALRWSGGDERAATIAALVFAFHWIPLAFGSTAYPRTLAGACVVAGALLLETRDARWAAFAAGALAGLAFADRFSEIVFLVPLLVLARRRALLVAAGAAVVIAITVGWYDFVTWGAPFSSAIDFANLTLARPDFASLAKYQSPFWYLGNLARWCSPALLPLLWFVRDRRPWLFVLVPLVVLSAIAHKELRYLQVLVPFLAIAAALGFARMRNRKVALALVLLALVTNVLGVRTFARKTMPAVLAARDLARDGNVGVLVVSQAWSSGDRLYVGDRVAVRDAGTPPVRLDASLDGADGALLYASDVDATVAATLAARRFSAVRTYRDGSARAVVLFRRAGSASTTMSSPGSSDASGASSRCSAASTASMSRFAVFVDSGGQFVSFVDDVPRLRDVALPARKDRHALREHVDDSGLARGDFRRRRALTANRPSRVSNRAPRDVRRSA